MNPVLVLIVHVLVIANLFISMTHWRRILVPYMYMPRFFKDLEIKLTIVNVLVNEIEFSRDFRDFCCNVVPRLIYLSMKLNYSEIFVTFVVM